MTLRMDPCINYLIILLFPTGVVFKLKNRLVLFNKGQFKYKQIFVVRDLSVLWSSERNPVPYYSDYQAWQSIGGLFYR